MTFFLVIDLFRILYMVFFHRGGQIRSRHRYGGAKLLTSIALSVPQGGQTPLRISMGGAMAGFAPPGSATVYIICRNDFIKT